MLRSRAFCGNPSDGEVVNRAEMEGGLVASSVVPWILDLDGVVWRGDTPVPGAIAAIDRLRAHGERVLFLTNNSSAPIDGYVAKMASMGLRATADEICSSAQASALLVEPGETALVCGGPGIVEALTARGVRCVRNAEPGVDVVVVGGIATSPSTASPRRSKRCAAAPA